MNDNQMRCVDYSSSSLITDRSSLITNHSSLLLITLIGFLLRILLLDGYPFREDEAIYSYWALHAWDVDPLFLTVWPDKPPLFLWLASLAYILFGLTEASTRWLNIAASTLTIPITAKIAGTLTEKKHTTQLIAALAMALNPFAISFAPTAYTDAMLVCLGMASVLMMTRRHYFWAGVWLGCAIMTKQQGVLYIPLVLGCMYVAWTSLFTRKDQDCRVDNRTYTIRASPRFLIGILFIIMPILYWDSLRWAVAPSPWDMAQRNYVAITLLAPDQWWSRWLVWRDLLWYLTASSWVWGLLAIIILVIIADKISSLSILPEREGERLNPQEFSLPLPRSRYTSLFLLWGLGYLAIHILTTIPAWDRYLLPLAPIVALLMGVIGTYLWSIKPPALQGRATGRERVSYILSLLGRRALLLLMLVLSIQPSIQAASGRLPIGGDHGAYDGYREAVQWVKEQLTEDDAVQIVLYHRVLGWHHRFYFYEEIHRGDMSLRWFPHEVYLADNAAKTPHRRRLLITPQWVPLRTLELHLQMHHLTRQEKAVFGAFTLYEITQPMDHRCDWCLCQPKSTIFSAFIFQDGSQSDTMCKR
ncbi:MAG: glycosyltransferase family 39 protein [Chloroflexota bacterium]